MTVSVNSQLAIPQDSDLTRAQRFFVGLNTTIVGPDQNMNGEDPMVAQSTGQFVIANPDGTQSVQGIARSNVQSQSTPAAKSGVSPMVVLSALAAGALFLM